MGTPGDPARRPGRRHVALLVLGCSAGVAVDQWTKALARAHSPGPPLRTLIPGLLQLRPTHNRGALLSLGIDLPEPASRTILIAAGCAAVILLWSLWRRLQPRQSRLRFALGGLLAGALGNLVDRVRRGAVTDFLHLHFGAYFDAVTFNVADVFLATGMALLIIEAMRPQTPPAVGGRQPSPVSRATGAQPPTHGEAGAQPPTHDETGVQPRSHPESEGALPIAEHR